MQTWQLFWAKTNRENLPGLPSDWVHPLWTHLLDVGNAAQVLWDRYLPQQIKQAMAGGIGLPLDEVGRFLSVWIGLHDLGKAIPSFQGLHPASRENLQHAGLYFHDEAERMHHGHASIGIMCRLLNDQGYPPFGLLEAASACVGIHHGKLCLHRTWKDAADRKGPTAAMGDAGWRVAQAELAYQVLTAWGAPWPDKAKLPRVSLSLVCPDWLMYYAGWATLADWLGSMQSCYPEDAPADSSLTDYIPRSREGAENAFRQASLDHSGQLVARPLAEHFGPGFVPRPLQETARDLPLSGAPSMVIIESSTGDGKTEAGFILSARHGGGVYVAMPSQATANGLYARLQEFLAGNSGKGTIGAHNGEKAGVRLVHGNDLLRDDASLLLTVSQSLHQIRDQDSPENAGEGNNRTLTWFLPKKRALLSAYGVGTVDQAFLGVLHARHFFLRLFALAGKTVIFDEVHAYDTYMNAIFERLLHWLKAIGAHVVVLSATLPGETRQSLLKAWGVEDDPGPVPAPYPVAWQAAGGNLNVLPFEAAGGRGQRLYFEWCGAEVEAIVKKATEMVKAGACVLVVCNKVDRAQEVFRRLEEQLADVLPDPGDRLLLHARLPQAWRRERELHALRRFGKNRPSGPGLLVGTQVVEQSLDLDADALITDLAPVDLVLQRAGRLHRHLRAFRPPGFENPRLIIACSPAEAGELPGVDDISGRGYIYGKAILWKTWALLRQASGWSLPLGEEALPGYRALVEGVYGELNSPPSGLSAASERQYNGAYKEWMTKNNRQENDAVRRLVPDTGQMKELFITSKAALTEEDETDGKMPEYLQAFTRNPDGVNVEVILVREENSKWCLPSDSGISLHPYPPREFSADELRAVFGAAVRITKHQVVEVLLKQAEPRWVGWQEKNRALKRFYLLPLRGNRCAVGGITIRLDERLGVVYHKN